MSNDPVDNPQANLVDTDRVLTGVVGMAEMVVEGGDQREMQQRAPF